MENSIGADAVKLAGLQIDMLQKMRSGQITMAHYEWFLKLSKAQRDMVSGADLATLKSIPKSPYATLRRIFNKDLLGLEAVNKVYGLCLTEKDLPSLNCSEAELRRFKKLGFQLILQVDKTKEGKPVTIREINKLANGKTSDGGKLLYSSDGTNIKSDAWYKNEPFLDVPLEPGWRLSYKGITPSTTDQDYANQTEILIEHLNKVFNGNFFPKCQEPRESITELIYRMHLTEAATGEKLFPDTYVWTGTRVSDGRFVSGGHFDRSGADVYSFGPDSVWYSLGASLSLKL